jgi:hypothetical protein
MDTGTSERPADVGGRLKSHGCTHDRERPDNDLLTVRFGSGHRVPGC